MEASIADNKTIASIDAESSVPAELRVEAARGRWLAGEERPAGSSKWGAKGISRWAGLLVLGASWRWLPGGLGVQVGMVLLPGMAAAAAAQMSMPRGGGRHFIGAAKAAGMAVVSEAWGLGRLGAGVGQVALGAVSGLTRGVVGARGSAPRAALDRFSSLAGKKVEMLSKRQADLGEEDPSGLTEIGSWRAAWALLDKKNPSGAARVWLARPFNPDWLARGVGDEAGSKFFGRPMPFKEALWRSAKSVHKEPCAKLDACLSAIKAMDPDFDPRSFYFGADAPPGAAEGMFARPAPLVLAPRQRVADGGRYLLIADRADMAAAAAAALACSREAKGLPPMPEKRLGAFGSMVRGAALACRLASVSREPEWMAAVGMASSALNLMGRDAPAPSSVPLEFVGHGLKDSFLSMVDLVDLFSKKTSKAGNMDSAIAASKLGSLAKIMGPSFARAAFGPGTERIFIKTRGSKTLEEFVDRVGDGLGLVFPAKDKGVAARAFVILHETFHLQQSWASGVDGSSDARALLPKGFVAQDRFGWVVGRHAAGKTPDVGRWSLTMLQESYADIMGSCALAGFSGPESAAACGAIGYARVGVGMSKENVGLGPVGKGTSKVVGLCLNRLLSKKSKASLRGGVRAIVKKMRVSDPHMTAVSLSLMEAELGARGAGPLDPAEASELAKSCAMAGLLSQCAFVIEEPAMFDPRLRAEAVRVLRMSMGKAAWREPPESDPKRREAWVQKMASAALESAREIMLAVRGPRSDVGRTAGAHAGSGAASPKVI